MYRGCLDPSYWFHKKIIEFLTLEAGLDAINMNKVEDSARSKNFIIGLLWSASSGDWADKIIDSESTCFSNCFVVSLKGPMIGIGGYHIQTNLLLII